VYLGGITLVEFDIQPAKTALLIIDMTNVFLEPGAPIMVPEGLSLIPGLNKLMDVSRNKGIKVIFTTQAYRKDGSNLGVHVAFSPELDNSDVTREGTHGVEFHKDLRRQEDDIIIKKSRFSAFIGTDLDLILRGKGIDTLIVGGVLTNVCCESTTRDARMLDYKVIFLSDGTATIGIHDPVWGEFTAAEVQRYTLAVIAHHFAQVSTVDYVVGRIQNIK
jgi:nicotinamidase-related amidase